MADWTSLANVVPTDLSIFEIRISKNKAGTISKSYSAKIENQDGDIYTSANGILDSYLNAGQISQLELVVGQLFTKAQEEMIP